MLQPAYLPSARINARVLIKIMIYTAVVIAGYAFLRGHDADLVRWRYRVMPAVQPDWMLQVLSSFRAVGQYMTIPLIMVLVITYDVRWRKIVAALLIAEVIALAGFRSVKHTWPRYRPRIMVEHISPADSITWDKSWVSGEVTLPKDNIRSFGSGHSGGAFAMAAVMAYFYPQAAWLFFVAALGCGVSRFFDAEHWPTDIWLGANIGLAAGWVGLRVTRLIIER